MSIKSRKSNKIIFWTIILSLGLIILVFKLNQTPIEGPLKGKTAVVYRSATCGCCANYITYLRRAGVKVEEKLTEDADEINRQFGISEELSSCHTTIIDGYVVVGHIPVEAIQKLLAEKPAIVGIALPRMPSGSPGMPGKKFGTFDIYSFTSVNSSSPYLSL